MKEEFKWLEWEVFPKIECDIIDYGNLEKYYKNITIWRDENYQILFEVNGIIEDQRNFRFPSETRRIRVGETVIIDKIVKVKPKDKNPDSIIDLDGLSITNSTKNGLGEIKSKGQINNLKFYYDYNKEFGNGDILQIGNEEEAEIDEEFENNQLKDFNYINYWFLNANKDLDFSIFRTIDYSDNLVIEYDGYIKDIVNPNIHQESSLGFQKLKVFGNDFLLGYVKPETTNNFPGTSLRFSKESILNDEHFPILQVALSFVLGVELIYIGYTKYNRNHSPVEIFLKNTHSIDIKNICKKTPLPPIPITIYNVSELYSKHRNSTNLSSDINNIINKFFEYSDDFPLYKMVRFIHTSRLHLLDLAIQPLSTALDIFQIAWFKSEKSISHGKYFDEVDYNEIIDKYIGSIEKDLIDKQIIVGSTNIEKNKSIINKIKNANYLSINQKNKIIFSEMNLEIGDVEKEVLIERNTVIHGSLKATDYNRLSLLTNSFYSLLYRIILKLFEYDGVYIDYSAYGFPLKIINEKLGGPENDGLFPNK